MDFEGPMNTPAQWTLSTYEYPPQNELPGLINTAIQCAFRNYECLDTVIFQDLKIPRQKRI